MARFLNNLLPLNTSDYAVHGPLEPMTMAQRPEGHTIYSRIRSANKIPTHKHNAYYADDELELGGPRNGFSSVAAMHVQYPNTNTHRAFRIASQRLLTSFECQITCLLDEVDKIDSQEPLGFPFDKHQFIRRCMQSPNQGSLCEPPKEVGDLITKREYLLANIDCIFKKYRDLLHWEHDTNKFSRVSWKTHRHLADHIKESFPGDQSTLEYLRAMDDFIYADPNPPLERFQHLLLVTGNWLARLLRWLFCGTLRPRQGHSRQRVDYLEASFKVISNGLLAVIGSVLVLVPVGLLYLGHLGKPYSFLVVVLFGLTFTGLMLAFEPRTGHFFVGIAAYYAVLVAFLSNAE
ncbi:hypothetical protein HD806DRAFT_536896 [Xylariaceae sp. AK1471]|nr:hypothetical protein HD806DRAFT_536896 [Xylariaceae sp. AK1471]